MGIKSKKEIPDFFDVRIKTGGKRGEDMRKIVEEKMKAECRKTYADTIEAIVLQYCPPVVPYPIHKSGKLFRTQ